MPPRFSTHEVVNQTPPYTPRNLFALDPLLRTILEPALDDTSEGDLARYGQIWGTTETLELARLANHAAPQLKTHDAYGRRIDVVEFHPSYHALMRRSADAGLHCSSWERNSEDGGRATVMRAARYYLTAQVESGHLWPMSMTHAALAPIAGSQQLRNDWVPRILQRGYDHRFLPADRKKAVTIGIALTEKQIGTDLQKTTTRAERAGAGQYHLTGHKWFLSAPMSDAFLMLAQAQEGLGCFFVPRFASNGAINGLRMQRLKDKLGNRSNATAETEIADAEAYLVGQPGEAESTIRDMLTLSRLDTALTSAALMRSLVGRAVHHTHHRRAFGKPLFDQPLMTRVLSDLALDVAAATALTFALASAVNAAPNDRRAAIYTRIMTPAIKYWVCKAVPAIAAEALEVLGGNGYVEDHDLAVNYRDAPAGSILHGPGNVMCLEVLNALRSEPSGLDIVLEQISKGLGATGPASVDVLHAAARACLEDQGSARILTEQLALTAAAAELSRVVPRQIADAFIDSRLAGQWRATYGMLDARFDFAGILNYLFPQPSREQSI